MFEFSEIQGILPKGLENMVPLSESPTYPGSHLSEAFLMKFDKEVHGTYLSQKSNKDIFEKYFCNGSSVLWSRDFFHARKKIQAVSKKQTFLYLIF